MQQTYIITTTQMTVNPGFTVKQFSVFNPSGEIVYINPSADMPNTTRFTFSVQPHSSFSSPEITTTVLSVFYGGANKLNPPSIVIADTFLSQPSANIPYETDQYVSLIGYPVLAGNAGSSKSLPTITLDNLRNIIFTVSNLYSGDGGSIARLQVFTDTGLGLFDYKIRVFGFGGGVFTYTPTRYPSLVRPVISMIPDALGVEGFISVNAFKSPILLNNSLDDRRSITLSAGATNTLYLGINPPGYILSMSLNNGLGSSFTPNLVCTMDVLPSPSLAFGFSENRIFSGTFNSVLAFPPPFVIYPRVRHVATPSILKIVLTNNAAFSTTVVIGNHALEGD